MFLTFDELRVKKTSLYCAFYLLGQTRRKSGETNKQMY